MPSLSTWLEGHLVEATDVSPVVARTALMGALSLSLTLAAHFVAVPLRDECGAAVGQAALPALFLASLPLTGAAAPLVGGWLAAAGAAGRGGPAVARLLRALAAVEAVTCLTLAATAGASSRPPRVFYFCWRSAANTVALSAVWARVLASLGGGHGGAASTPSSLARRLVGPLGAAATGGQLAGSAAVAVFSWACVVWGRGDVSGGPPAALLALPAAGAAACLAVAAAVVSTPLLDGGAGGGDAEAGTEEIEGGNPPPPTAAAALAAAAGDPLSRALAVLMGLASACSAWSYLVKQAVVSAAAAAASAASPPPTAALAAPGAPPLPPPSVAASAARMAWFATIAAASAAGVATLQLTATGTALAVLPPGAALAAGPAVASAGFAAVALFPSPATVALAEAGRKAADYGLSRPARDAAFAALPRPVLFAARLALDALAPRVGDAAAAAGVGLLRLGGALRASPAPAAAAAVPVALAAVWAAGRTGRAQVRAGAGRVV